MRHVSNCLLPASRSTRAGNIHIGRTRKIRRHPAELGKRDGMSWLGNDWGQPPRSFGYYPVPTCEHPPSRTGLDLLPLVLLRSLAETLVRVVYQHLPKGAGRIFLGWGRRLLGRRATGLAVLDVRKVQPRLGRLGMGFGRIASLPDKPTCTFSRRSRRN